MTSVNATSSSASSSASSINNTINNIQPNTTLTLTPDAIKNIQNIVDLYRQEQQLRKDQLEKFNANQLQLRSRLKLISKQWHQRYAKIANERDVLELEVKQLRSTTGIDMLLMAAQINIERAPKRPRVDEDETEDEEEEEKLPVKRRRQIVSYEMVVSECLGHDFASAMRRVRKEKIFANLKKAFRKLHKTLYVGTNMPRNMISNMDREQFYTVLKACV